MTASMEPRYHAMNAAIVLETTGAGKTLLLSAIKLIDAQRFA